MNPSVRACSPSATSAAEPISRPTRIRWRATHSFPANPTSAATATAQTCATGRGSSSRSTAAQAANATDAPIVSTIAIPARAPAPP